MKTFKTVTCTNGLRMIGLSGALFVSAMSSSITMAQEIAGYTRPSHDITLSSAVSAPLIKLHKQEGEYVKKGDLILTLENRRETLEQNRRELIWKDKSELESATKREKLLAEISQSSRALYNKTASISLEEVQRAELEYEMVKSELERIKVQEEREKIEYQLARNDRNQRLVYAPISGVITKVHYQIGERCNLGEPLVKIANAQEAVFVSNVEEHIGRNLTTNQTVTLKLPTGRSETLLQGKVSFRSPVVDPASGLMEIKVMFDNKEGTVNPGVSGVLLLQNQAESQELAFHEEHPHSTDSFIDGSLNHE